MLVQCELEDIDWAAVEHHIAYQLSALDVLDLLRANFEDTADPAERRQIETLPDQRRRQLLLDVLRGRNLCTAHSMAIAMDPEGRRLLPIQDAHEARLEELVKTIDMDLSRCTPVDAETRARHNLAERSLLAWLTGDSGYPGQAGNISVSGNDPEQGLDLLGTTGRTPIKHPVTGELLRTADRVAALEAQARRLVRDQRSEASFAP